MHDTSATPGRPVISTEVTVNSLLDRLLVGSVLLDATGHIALWSPTAHEALGWPGGSVLGRPFSSLIVDGRETGGRAPGPGPWSGDGERLYATLLRERYWRGILVIRRPDGQHLETEVSASLLTESCGEPMILVHVVEVSRLREVEQDLAALDALYASTHVGVAIFDTERRYVRANTALARLHYLPVGELIGKTVQQLLPEPVADKLSALQESVLRTGRPVVDAPMPGAYGSGRRSVSYTRLSDRSGAVLGFSATIMDTTEQVEALEKTERARRRLQLLNDVGLALGELLDVDRSCQTLVQRLVPRFADYAGAAVQRAVVHGGDIPEEAGPTALLMLGTAGKDSGPAVDRLLAPGPGREFRLPSFFDTVMQTGEHLLVTSQQELRNVTAPGTRLSAALELGVSSVIAVPLSARNLTLGLLVMGRTEERNPFDEDDVALAREIAGRAGISLENARLYTCEREVALMLQRSLLPQRVISPPGVRIAYRYVPGGSGTEVGGDWFDVIHLSGGRLAFVVGDVMGHGLRAAATMGRLRTAVRTLAALDLPPAELLSRLNDLADDLAPGPEFPLMATCLYAVYDPATRRCALAKAGHLPPVLLTGRKGEGDRWTAEPIELPSGAPLGVGGVSFESCEAEIEQGAVLVLYTDGLIETRDEDISVGVARLCDRLSSTGYTLSLEEACDDIIETVGSSGESDDVALLMAQFGDLPTGTTVTWSFPAQAHVVRHIRAAVRRTLRDWNLNGLAQKTTLLVSELVTNALRYAQGPIGVRMMCGASLLVEVSDPSTELPRERAASEHDEGGRGIQLVSRESHRWGTRQGPHGKTVWFELTLPG